MKLSGRVLVTELPELGRLRALAASIIEGGLLVGLGTREDVYEARGECADLDHVMFVEGSRDEIPWAEGWFDVIVDPEPESPTPEMRRVLRSGGMVVGQRSGES